ncbi:MAG TPA: GtrA family protein [Hyphomicrobium sp.]|nr:GtrA family protein [Hyphomicrobium sp.]
MSGLLLGEAIRYAAVGLVTFAVFVGVNAGLLAVADWAPSFVTSLAVVVASLVNFFGHARFTFRTRATHAMAPGYILLLLFNAGLAGIVVAVGVEHLGLSVAVANAVALVLVTLSSFLLMKYAVMAGRERFPR